MLACAEGVKFIWEPFSLSYHPPIMCPPPPYWFYHITTAKDALYQSAMGRVLSYEYSFLEHVRYLHGLGSLGRLFRDYREFSSARRQGLRPLVKDPIAIFSAPWFEKHFDGQIVVTIRHPAAFCESLIRSQSLHPFIHFYNQKDLMDGPLVAFKEDVQRMVDKPGGPTEQAILLWKMIYQFVRDCREAGTGWHFVKHEDLVAQPTELFGSLYRDLGLPWGPTIKERIANGRKEDTNKWRKRLDRGTVRRIRQSTEELTQYFYGNDAW